EMIEGVVGARNLYGEDPLGFALVTVEPPVSRLRFAAGHQLADDAARILVGVPPIGQGDAYVVIDRVRSVAQLEGVVGHFDLRYSLKPSRLSGLRTNSSSGSGFSRKHPEPSVGSIAGNPHGNSRRKRRADGTAAPPLEDRTR